MDFSPRCIPVQLCMAKKQTNPRTKQPPSPPPPPPPPSPLKKTRTQKQERRRERKRGRERERERGREREISMISVWPIAAIVMNDDNLCFVFPGGGYYESQCWEGVGERSEDLWTGWQSRWGGGREGGVGGREMERYRDVIGERESLGRRE